MEFGLGFLIGWALVPPGVALAVLAVVVMFWMWDGFRNIPAQLRAARRGPVTAAEMSAERWRLLRASLAQPAPPANQPLTGRPHSAPSVPPAAP